MNANELIERLKRKNYLGELDSRNKIVWLIRITKQEHEDIISTLSRSRIRETATEPPTEEDANERGFILAWCEDVSNNCDSRWSFEPYRYVTAETAKVFPKWTQLPESPHDNT